MKQEKKVQYYRSKFMGIMVGINTVVSDNPSLTLREKNGRNPYRIVIDPNLKITENFNIVFNNNDEKTIIITSEINKSSIKQKDLREKYNIKFIYLKRRKFTMKEMLEKIGRLGIDSVFLEGGEKLISLAFKENVIDAGEIFIANKILGDSKAKAFVSGFTPKEMNDVLVLENVKNNIYGENIGMEFYMKKYN